MRIPLLLHVALLFGLCSTASAQMTVIGGGLAKDCYESAKSDKPIRSAVVSGSPRSAAIQVCSLALRQEAMNAKNRAATHVNRGVLFMRNGSYERAMSDYDKAISLKPEAGEAYLNRGAAWIYQREYYQAIDDLDTAIELESGDLFAAYYNRAIAYEASGDVTAAYYDFKKALELKPEFELAANQLERFEVNAINNQ